VIDPFQQAVAETLPVLKNIQAGFGPLPAVSNTALARLRSLTARKPVPSPPPPGPVRDAAPAAPRVAEDRETTAWTLDTLREAALACVKCPHLVRSRTQVVFGVGNPQAELMFVGEAPGADEDEQGEPFVGKAGQLLTKIIQAMGFTREEVYIGNVLKCRPDMPAGSSGNRKPTPEEMRTCLPWLEKQIALIKPRALVALGATAVEGLLGNTEPVGRLRGRFLEFHGIPVMTTYHPAYLLRNQSITEKRKVWEDMLQVLEKLGKPISEKQRQFFTKAG
jgi:uracil-DNA glycosylase family 4